MASRGGSQPPGSEPVMCPPGVHSMFDPCPGDCEQEALDSCAECGMSIGHKMNCVSGRQHINTWYAHFGAVTPHLTQLELDAIQRGEPYCFLCGKPASAFPEYDDLEVAGGDRADYVRNEEGTYNPENNRFACTEDYIRIGMPVSRIPFGPRWTAP